MADNQQLQSRSNGFWVRVGATVVSGLLTAFFLVFLAAKVWAHEGAVVRIETRAEERHKNVMGALKRIEGRLDDLASAKRR